MPRFRAELAYDGTGYQGFQRQADGIPTVQGTVEAAIQALSGQAVTVIGAGRTDSGVHASGQVIAFDLAWNHADDALLRALNVHLPNDVAVQYVCQQPGFHPRFDAIARRYRYMVLRTPVRQPLWRDRSWQINRDLDVGRMQTAAGLLIGTHDFASFGNPPQGTNTVRTVTVSRWDEQGDLLVYTVEANAFLHHMVRRMVGLQVDLGLNRITVEEFTVCFRAADLSHVRTIAPPQGLILEKVRYDGAASQNRCPDSGQIEA